MSKTESKTGNVVSATKALADPVRWQIVQLLADGPKTASELGSGFSITAPAISRHLKVLLGGDIVGVESKGRQRVYSLQAETLSKLATDLGRAAGQPQRVAPASPTPARATRPVTPSAPSSDWRSW